MMEPTPDERREAVRIARELVDEVSRRGIDEMSGLGRLSELVLVCRTLLAAQHAFAERLAPVYEAAMRAFDDHGNLVGDGTFRTLIEVVIDVKRKESKP